MIDVEMTLNGVKTIKSIPTRWSEITFEMFLKLDGCKDDAHIFALFTGISVETIRKVKIKNVDSVLALLSFLRTNPDPTPIPDEILGYPIPKDLAFETIGQYEDLKDSLKTERNGIDKLRQYPLYCAVYACSHKHGEYDWQKAEAMAHEFLKAPAVEVLAIGNFTLAKLIALMKGTTPDFLMQAVHRKKSRPVLRGWHSSLASIRRFFTWRPKRHIGATNF